MNHCSSTAYVIVHAGNRGSADWVRTFLHVCIFELLRDLKCDVLEESYFDGTTDPSDFSMKVIGVNGYALASRLASNRTNGAPADVSVAVIPGVEDQSPLRGDAVQISYYRDPTKVDGMAVWTDSCVRLVHVLTGVEARCQAFRSRAINLEEAMVLLRSKLSAQEVRDALLNRVLRSAAP